MVSPESLSYLKILETKRPCGSSSSEDAGRKSLNSERKGYFSRSIAAYLGIKIRASWPKSRRALGKERITSPNPPTLIKGAASEATKRSRSLGSRLKILIWEMILAMNIINYNLIIDQLAVAFSTVVMILRNTFSVKIFGRNNMLCANGWEGQIQLYVFSSTATELFARSHFHLNLRCRLRRYSCRFQYHSKSLRLTLLFRLSRKGTRFLIRRFAV